MKLGGGIAAVLLSITNSPSAWAVSLIGPCAKPVAITVTRQYGGLGEIVLYSRVTSVPTVYEIGLFTDDQLPPTINLKLFAKVNPYTCDILKIKEIP